MTLREIALKLTNEYGFSTTDSDLSKARFVTVRAGDFHADKSTRYKTPKERKKLAGCLKALLEKEHKVELLNGYFCGTLNEDERQWGRLLSEYPDFGEEKPADSAVIIHDGLNYTNLYNQIRKAKFVRILQTYMRDSGLFQDSAREAIENGCKFEILLLEPYSEVIRLRAKGLCKNSRGEDVEGLVVSNYKVLSQLAEKFPRQFKFQTINELPSFTMLQLDSRIFVGFQWYQKLAQNGAYLEFHKDSPNPMLEDINEHFAELWKDAEKKNFDVTFDCHFFRNGVKTVRTLSFNSVNYEALFQGTHHKIDFHGSIIEMLEGNSCLFLQTKLKDALENQKEEKRVGCFFLNMNRNRLKDVVLAVGKFVVEFEPGEIRINTVVLENLNPSEVYDHNPKLSRRDKDALIKKFLLHPDPVWENAPTEAMFSEQISRWDQLETWWKRKNNR